MQRLEHPFSFDVRVVTSPCRSRIHLVEEEASPFTPRSKSLDLLRADASSPVARNSLDTISTLRCCSISSPIFLNSSNGVHPLVHEPRLETIQCGSDMEEGDGSDTFVSSVPSSNSLGAAADIRASTMPRHLTKEPVTQPKTPSRRQMSSDQLKSKFSMSPVQQSKRSKTRVSEDRGSTNRFPEGLLSVDGSRSTIGNWSHSLGMAARKLQKSALARKASDESHATPEVGPLITDKTLTPEKGKNSLRSATSIASIRRFM